MGMDPLMKKRLHYFEQTDRDLAWLTDRYASRPRKSPYYTKGTDLSSPPSVQEPMPCATTRAAALHPCRERSKEVRAAIFERLLMEEALSQDTIKDSRFWALRNLYGTKRCVPCVSCKPSLGWSDAHRPRRQPKYDERCRCRRRDVNGTAIDTRGAPDGVYVPVSEGTWERCRSQADWAFSLLLCNRDALGFAARQEREGPSADEVAEASGGERDSEQGGEGEAVAGPRQGDVGDEKGGGNGGEEGREGGEAEGAGGGSEGGGLEVEPWDYHDYQGYAEAFTSRLGGWSPEEERRRRDELGRAAVFFSARPDAEVPSLNRVVAGAGELFEDWSRGMLTAQYREKLEGTEPFKKEKGEGEGGEEMMEGGAVFAMLDSVDQVHGQLELLHRGSEAMMIQWAGEKETQARQMLQAARVKDDNVVEWVPGPALKRVYGVDPRNRSTWYLYDFAMGGNGSAPEVNAYLSDGAKARMFVKNQLFPSVFTVQRLAAEHKVRPQR